MRIHIDIRDDIPPVIALKSVCEVIKDGRTCNDGKLFNYATHFKTSVGPIWVCTNLYRKSDCFLVVKDKNEDNNENN